MLQYLKIEIQSNHDDAPYAYIPITANLEILGLDTMRDETALYDAIKEKLRDNMDFKVIGNPIVGIAYADVWGIPKPEGESLELPKCDFVKCWESGLTIFKELATPWERYLNPFNTKPELSYFLHPGIRDWYEEDSYFYCESCERTIATDNGYQQYFRDNNEECTRECTRCHEETLLEEGIDFDVIRKLNAELETECYQTTNLWFYKYEPDESLTADILQLQYWDSMSDLERSELNRKLFKHKERLVNRKIILNEGYNASKSGPKYWHLLVQKLNYRKPKVGDEVFGVEDAYFNETPAAIRSGKIVSIDLSYKEYGFTIALNEFHKVKVREVFFDEQEAIEFVIKANRQKLSGLRYSIKLIEDYMKSLESKTELFTV